MKKLLFFVLVSLLFVGCEKDLEPIGSGGVYINNELYIELRSASVGGSTPEPSKGHTHRCYIYEEKIMSREELFNAPEEKVFIRGFVEKDKSYVNFGDVINRIDISGIPAVGDLSIKMNQGEYVGDDDRVSSVKINEYHFGQERRSKINIEVVLKDGKKISIVYTGMALSDVRF